MQRLSLKEQQLRLREDVILQTVNSLLAEKGYDLMTVDEVANLVGIAKASLYKHFESKQWLAAAAMVRVLDRVLEFVDAQPGAAATMEKLKAVMRWSLHEQLAGRMPPLAAAGSLRTALARHGPYLDRLQKLSDRLGAWIEAARAEGGIAMALPPELVLHSLCGRSSDPAATVLKKSGRYTDEQIVQLVTTACFEGLSARPA